MQIDSTLWYHVLMLQKACESKGEQLSRDTISNALQVPAALARELKFAIDNKDIIQLRPNITNSHDDQIEIILTDLHSPYHDKLALECVLNYCSTLPVTDVTLLGDIIDMYDISIFTKVDRDKKKSLAEEINETKGILKTIRGIWPDAVMRYKRGNHEFRIDKYIMENAEEIADLINDLFPVKLGLKEMGIEYIVEPFKIGMLWHLHGDEFPSKGGVQKVCSKAWQYVHDHFIMGHFHRTDRETKVHIDKNKLFNLNSVGWLGSKEAANYAPLNLYNQGFAIVRYSANGVFRVENKTVLNGEIY